MVNLNGRNKKFENKNKPKLNAYHTKVVNDI